MNKAIMANIYSKKSTSLAVIQGTMLLLAVMLSVPSAFGQAADGRSYFDLTLEELMEVVVLSPTKQPLAMKDAPNAIWVITDEDIRRTGVRSIPEALALAPGVYVTRSDGNSWNVTIGGFGLPPFSSNNLLVLLDGVTVYSTLSGNVEWDLLPVTLQEVTQIEVIRGPGGVLYGANAVNGVISILTGSDSSRGRQEVGTQGVFLAHGTAALQSASGHFNAVFSGGYEEDNGLGKNDGDEYRDNQRLSTASVRTVTRLTEKTSLIMDGRHKRGEFRTSTTPGVDNRKAGVTVFRIRADHASDTGASTFLQLFGRRQLLFDEEGTLGDTVWDEREDSQVADIEFQRAMPFGDNGQHTVKVGGGYRSVSNDHEILTDGGQEYVVKNLYLHDSWQLAPRWRLDAGVKWEDVDLVDPTVPWSAGLNFTPGEGHSLRLAVSTSYRSPTLLESYQEIIFFPGAGIFGNPDLEPEEVVTWELGYRGALKKGLYLDISTALKRYRDVIANYEETPDTLFKHKNDGDATGTTADVGIDAVFSGALRSRVVFGFVDVQFDGSDAAINYEQEGGQVKQFGRADLTWTPGSLFRANLAGNYRGKISGSPVDERWLVDLNLVRSFKMKSGDLEIGTTGTNILGSDERESATDKSIPTVYSIYMDYMF